jgi:hypothetical protein
MTLRDRAGQCLEEAKAFPVGSMSWEYLTRAAWKYDQMSRGIPAVEWTEWPPQLMETAA